MEQTAPNGHATMAGTLSADGNTYTFTERERAYFEAQMREVSQMMRAVNNAAGLVCAQNGLEGAWSIKEDATGLIRRQPAANLQ